MPSGDSELQWINLVDFTPGIFDDYYSGGNTQPAPDGAAQLTGTYGCVCSPAGGLMGGPTSVNTASDNGTLAGSPFDASHYPADLAVHMIGMRNVAGLSQAGFGIANIPDDVFVLWQAYFTATPGTTNVFVKGIVREYQQYSGSSFTPNTISTTSDDTGAKTAPGVGSYGLGSIDLTRANVAAPTSPGSIEVAIVYYPSLISNGSVAGARIVYPDNATPQTVSTHAITFASNFVGFVLGHQDRLVAFHAPNTSSIFSQFPDTGGSHTYSASTEELEYTNPNDYTHSGGTLQVVSENPSGYGSWVSMNANQLFLVKQVGGGVSITGPLENPNVTRLPGIPSTFGPINKGCILPNGTYVYGTRYGVHAWSGGDSANLISPQLDGSFWVPPFAASTVSYISTGNTPTLSPVQGMVGSFAFAYPYVYCPNNFLYDIRTNGWWRLDQSTTPSYAFYDVGGGGHVIAGIEQLLTSGGSVVLAWYSNTKGQNSWSWKSQPLKRAMNRLVTVRELVVEASIPSGSGTIQVQVFDLTNTVVSDQTITVNTTYPKAQRMRVGVQSYGIVVNVVATGSAGVTAPRLESLNIGYHEEMAVA